MAVNFVNTTPVVSGVPGEEGSSGSISNIATLVNGSPSTVSATDNESRWYQLLDQNKSASEAEEMLKTLAKEDPAYREMYLQVLAERENEADARRWYENFSNTYFQRTAKDLEAAGYNPWLMLQSLGSSGSGSLQAAGTWSGSSGTSSKVKREEIEAQNKQRVMTTAVSIIGAIIAAIALAAA